MKYLAALAIILLIAFALTRHSIWDGLPWGKPVVDTELHELDGTL